MFPQVATVEIPDSFVWDRIDRVSFERPFQQILSQIPPTFSISLHPPDSINLRVRSRIRPRTVRPACDVAFSLGFRSRLARGSWSHNICPQLGFHHISLNERNIALRPSVLLCCVQRQAQVGAQPDLGLRRQALSRDNRKQHRAEPTPQIGRAHV